MISAQLQGKKALDLTVEDRKFEARVELPKDMRNDITCLETMNSRNKDGVYIPFSEVAHIEYRNVPLSIEKQTESISLYSWSWQ